MWSYCFMNGVQVCSSQLPVEELKMTANDRGTNTSPTSIHEQLRDVCTIGGPPWRRPYLSVTPFGRKVAPLTQQHCLSIIPKVIPVLAVVVVCKVERRSHFPLFSLHHFQKCLWLFTTHTDHPSSGGAQRSKAALFFFFFSK